MKFINWILGGSSKDVTNFWSDTPAAECVTREVNAGNRILYVSLLKRYVIVQLPNGVDITKDF